MNQGNKGAYSLDRGIARPKIQQSEASRNTLDDFVKPNSYNQQNRNKDFVSDSQSVFQFFSFSHFYNDIKSKTYIVVN